MKLWLERLFLLLIFSLGFMQPHFGFRGVSLQATELIFAATAVLFGLAMVFVGRRVLRDPSYFYLIAFGLAMGLSALFSAATVVSAVKLMGIVYLSGLAVLTVNIVTSAEILKKVVFAWLSASTLVSLIGAITVLLFYIDRSSP